jgi:hypothetical protein
MADSLLALDQPFSCNGVHSKSLSFGSEARLDNVLLNHNSKGISSFSCAAGNKITLG